MAPAHPNDTNRRGLSATLIVGLVVLFAVHLSHAQGVGGWQSHTPFRSVQDLASSGETVWAATEGGVFSYTLPDMSLQTFTSTSGLYGIDAQAIAYDQARDAVWIGYRDGVLDRVDASTGAVQSFLDIQRADQFSSRKINRLRVFGDTVYVATDFGLVLFDPIRLEVRDSFSKLGSFNAAIRASDVLTAPSPDGDLQVWVATDEGLARAPLSAINLREPAVWTIEAGLPQSPVLSLAPLAGNVVAGTSSDGYAKLPDGNWAKLGLSGDEVSQLIVWNDLLVAVERFSIVFLNDQLQSNRVFVGFASGTDDIAYEHPTSVVVDGTGKLWFGDRIEGMLGLGGIENVSGTFRSNESILPDGPFFGLFTDLEIDQSGALWASGGSGGGTGFYRFADGEWTTFTSRFVPELDGRNTYDFIHVDGTGAVWVGSEGFGAAMLSTEGAVEVFDAANSSLRPAPGTNFTRVRGIGSESNGTVWLINQFVNTPLAARLSDGTWIGLPALRGDGLSSTVAYDRIFVDGFDQKWIIPLRSEGLIVWSTEGTQDDTSDDRFKYLRGRGSGGRGLPDENVRAWAEDRSGRVWIGTERGIGIYFVPSLVISNDPNSFEAVWPIAEDRSGFLLRDLFVNDIAVDAADRKWIASTTGAWLINADGTEVLKHFTTDNSPLFSNEVVAIAVNNFDGEVYFATERGLLSYQDDPINPAIVSDDLFVFPNPVRANADGSLPPVFIEGLVAETDIRITSADGTLVARIDGRGGRVRWDGRDLNGAFVPSGIYLIIGLGLNDEGAGYGKVAVLR